MKITEEQKKVLDSFSCERLAGKLENMWIVEDFYNSRNPQLEQNLKDKAYEEDENNTTAYYVIKLKLTNTNSYRRYTISL